MPNPLETARAEHRRTVLHERRAAEARQRRDDAVRDALRDGVAAATIARLLGVTEGAIRRIRRNSA